MAPFPWLLPVLSLVAFLYASVGHAGASGYVAVLALAGLAPVEIRPLALALNLVVAAQGCWQFQRAGHLPWPLFRPLVLAGLPAALDGVDGARCRVRRDPPGYPSPPGCLVAAPVGPGRAAGGLQAARYYLSEAPTRSAQASAAQVGHLRMASRGGGWRGRSIRPGCLTLFAPAVVPLRPAGCQHLPQRPRRGGEL